MLDCWQVMVIRMMFMCSTNNDTNEIFITVVVIRTVMMIISNKNSNCSVCDAVKDSHILY